MASFLYNSAKRDLKNGTIDLNSDTIYGLVTNGYTPNKDTHTKRSDISNESSGSGYSSGGIEITGKSLTQDNAIDKSIFDADDYVIDPATLSGDGIVLYKRRGGLASADELIAYIDLGGVKASTGGEWKVAWSANGIFTFASSGYVYNSAKKELFDGTIDLDSDTIKALYVLGYTPNVDSHSKRSDVSSFEISGTGYTTGGVTLQNKTVSADNTDDEGVFDADDIEIDPSSIAADGVILYKSRGGLASADELIVYIPFGSTVTSTNSKHKITWGAEGILNLNDI